MSPGKAFTRAFGETRDQIRHGRQRKLQRQTCLLRVMENQWKYEEVYLQAYQNGKDVRIGIGDYLPFLTTMPDPPGTWLSDAGGTYLLLSPLEEPEKGVIESLTTSTINAAGHYLNLAPAVLTMGSTSLYCFPLR